MTRLPLVPLIVMSAVSAVDLGASAEVAPPSPTTNAAARAVVPLPRPRLVLTDTAELQSAAALARNESNPAAKAGVAPDLRDTDKTRSGIVRLPAYIVQEPRAPVFKEHDLLTPKGRLDLAYKRHPGLRFGNIWFLRNDGWGLAMLEEERRIERMAEFNDLVSLLPVSDGRSAAAKKEVTRAFLRSNGP